MQKVSAMCHDSTPRSLCCTSAQAYLTHRRKHSGRAVLRKPSGGTQILERCEIAPDTFPALDLCRQYSAIKEKEEKDQLLSWSGEIQLQIILDCLQFYRQQHAVFLKNILQGSDIFTFLLRLLFSNNKGEQAFKKFSCGNLRTCGKCYKFLHLALWMHREHRKFVARPRVAYSTQSRAKLNQFGFIS